MRRRWTIEYLTCECGKRGFDTERLARKALGRVRTWRRRRLGDLAGIHIESRTYMCPDSGLWHLTGESRRHYMDRTSTSPQVTPTTPSSSTGPTV